MKFKCDQYINNTFITAASGISCDKVHFWTTLLGNQMFSSINDI